jgi:hypothetical protein
MIVRSATFRLFQLQATPDSAAPQSRNEMPRRWFAATFSAGKLTVQEPLDLTKLLPATKK